ncbi:hypothetical protein GGS24DRAFT_462741 [Hypoxylon argillaceum]|nr:hypothetical protein GGS24DRAFT_462741 [Hypoxylon argillaceum]KAI1155790.1 hypothetical protein F4825DRAFT_406560 [Nemania diffusa]
MRPKSIIFGLAAVFVSPVTSQSTTDDDTDSTSATNDAASTSTTGKSTSSTTTAAAETSSSSLPGLSDTSSSSSSTSKSASTTTSVPGLTSSTSTGSLPPIPTSSASGTYSYPAPTVPPTKNAPFMQQSSLPQGTVFIAVGAILGAFAVAILVWRAVVACLLHRSVKRATLAQQVANDKNSYPPPSAPFYKYSDHASSISLGNAAGTRPTRKPRGPVPSATSQSNLFFSPTAPAGAGGNANRESRFLPSGFYASGAGSPQQGHVHSISLTNLRPESHGHARNVEPSPPDSPNLAPPADMGRRNLSSSTINLNRPPSGRAPSAFLEDLLGDQPEQFPPPGHRNTWNQPSNRF